MAALDGHAASYSPNWKPWGGQLLVVADELQSEHSSCLLITTCTVTKRPTLRNSLISRRTHDIGLAQR